MSGGRTLEQRPLSRARGDFISNLPRPCLKAGRLADADATRPPAGAGWRIRGEAEQTFCHAHWRNAGPRVITLQPTIACVFPPPSFPPSTLAATLVAAGAIAPASFGFRHSCAMATVVAPTLPGSLLTASTLLKKSGHACGGEHESEPPRFARDADGL